MLKKPLLLLIILLIVSSCSQHSFGNFFGNKKQNKYRNPDMQYLEDDYTPRRRTVVRNKTYIEEEPPIAHRDIYENHEEFEFNDEEDDDEDDYYDEMPAPRDRCVFYGLRPGTAAYQDCKRQLNKQKQNRGYYR